ncbi:hypothetical protein [Peribacillus frigoritolerans]|uniref:hypothetical protein n=1 Tax=Peribacillus frigoritolerans TaxID=450367 RepID=UPI00105A1651|nr:hypothetical protein [Peribacillus frigoritolerans]TDL75926.1 hypothetical protein E2R53_21470 [Peribacillus frigoritolerans]
MIRQCRGILLFEVLDIRNSLTIFWAILISCMALSFGIQLTIGGNLTVSSSAAVYIFSAIAGFMTVKETYPFSIKRGATRKNYYVATILFLLMLAMFLAAAHTLLIMVLEGMGSMMVNENFKIQYMAKFLGHENLYLVNFFIDGAIRFFLLSGFFLLGSLFYRFGLLGGYAAIGLGAVLLFIPAVRNEFIKTGFEFLGDQALLHFGYLIGIGAVFLAIGWFVLIKAAAKTVSSR